MGSQDLAATYRQLATLLESGISPGESFATMVRESRGSRKRMLEAMMRAVWRGQRITQAMAGFPRFFPRYHCTLLTEGETTGRFEITLGRMAEMTEHAWELRRQMQAVLARSAIAFVVAIPILVLLLPGAPSTLVLFAIFLIFLYIAILLLGFLMIQLPGGGRTWASSIAGHIPALNSLSQKLSIIYFTRSLALLYAGGVPLGQALRCAASACGDPKMVEAAQVATTRTDYGQRIVESLAASGAFTPFVPSLTEVAESAGDLEAQFEHVANYYEGQAVVEIHKLGLNLGIGSVIVVAMIVFTLYIIVMGKQAGR